MIKATESVKQDLVNEEIEGDLQLMIELLEGWQGFMGKDSIAASVYSYTMYYLHNSLFHSYLEDDIDNRLHYTDNYLFMDATSRMIESAATEGEASHFNVIC